MKESVVLPEPEPIEEVVSGELEKLGIEEILALKRSDLGKLSPGQLEEIYKQAKEEILRLSPEEGLPKSLEEEFEKTIGRNERLRRLALKGKGFFETFSINFLLKHFQENKLDLAAANRAYSEVIRGLEKLKAPPKGDAPVHDRWVRILSDPLKEVAQKHPEVSSRLH